MKKILVAAFFLLAGTNATFASERERPIAVQQLPALSKNFLSTHFGGLTLAYAVEESGLFGKPT